MKTSDRATFLIEKSEQLFDIMQNVAVIRDELEENGCKAEAKRTDTVTSKLQILYENLTAKASKLSD